MGMLEDLLLGLDMDWGSADFTGNLREAKLRKLLEEQYNKQQSPLGAGVSAVNEALAAAEDPFATSSRRAGLVDRAESPTTSLSDIAGGRIRDREEAEEDRGEAVIREAVDKKRRAKEEQQNQLDSVVSDMPADKLLSLRKGAADRPEGYTGGEGAFSQQDESTELTARLADRDRWLAGQSERDLEYAVTPERARRDPEYAASAAGNLKGLRAQRDMERRTANQEALVESLGDGGTLPFETAMKMEAAGMDIPWRAVGMSPKAAEAGIEEIFTGAEADLSKFANNEELMYREGSRETIEFLQYILAHRDRVGRMMQGGADPLKILEKMKGIAERHAKDSGAWAFWDTNMSQKQPETP